MRESRLVFVYNKNLNKFLIHEGTECFSKIALDKLGLNVTEVFDLCWGTIRKEGKEEVKEMNFILFTDTDKLKSNINYKWVNLDQLINEINWNDDKELLKRVLLKGINNEAYFDKKERGQ